MPLTTVAPTDVGVAVGDFFVSTWGYDQTNVDFFKVVGLTPKGVRVQKWSSKLVDDNGPITHVVPGECPRKGAWVRGEDGTRTWDREVDAPIETKRLQQGGRLYFRVTSYSSAYKWEGQPMFETGFGWGH